MYLVSGIFFFVLVCSSVFSGYFCVFCKDEHLAPRTIGLESLPSRLMPVLLVAGQDPCRGGKILSKVMEVSYRCGM